MLISLPCVIDLIEVSRDITDFVKVIRADLTDMHIYHKAVVSINLIQFIFSETFSWHPLANFNLFMGQDNLRMSLVVARSLHINNLHVRVNFIFVNFEEEVLFGGNLIVSGCSNTRLLLLRNLFFKAKEFKFLFNNLIDLCFNRVQVRMVTLNLLKLAIDTFFSATLLQILGIVCLSSLFL